MTPNPKDTTFEGITPEARKGLTMPVLLSWCLRFMHCAICGDRLVNGFRDDHIKPLSMGGDNSPANRQPLCPPCHSRKTNAEAPIRAKADRQGGRKGQYARRKRRGGSSIPSHVNGLQSRNTLKKNPALKRGLDGKVRART